MTALPSDAIALMFDADPATLTDSQFTALISELRRRRSAFASEEAAKSLAPKKSRTKVEPGTSAPALDKPIGEVSLDDLLG